MVAASWSIHGCILLLIGGFGHYTADPSVLEDLSAALPVAVESLIGAFCRALAQAAAPILVVGGLSLLGGIALAWHWRTGRLLLLMLCWAHLLALLPASIWFHQQLAIPMPWLLGWIVVELASLLGAMVGVYACLRFLHAHPQRPAPQEPASA